MQNQEFMQVKLPKAAIDSGKEIACPNCKSTRFYPVIRGVFISALNPTNSTGKNVIATVPAGVYCIGCNKEVKLDAITKEISKNKRKKAIN